MSLAERFSSHFRSPISQSAILADSEECKPLTGFDMQIDWTKVLGAQIGGLCSSPFRFSKCAVQNGLERSRARGFCAAEKGKGAGSRSEPLG